VKVVSDKDPVKEAIGEAMAVARTENCPEAALRHIVPALCREALSAAFVEVAWLRRNRTGRSAEELQGELDATDRLVRLAAVALFNDGAAHDDEKVRQRLRTAFGHDRTVLIHQCQPGAHPGGFRPDDPVAFVRKIENLADRIRTRGARLMPAERSGCTTAAELLTLAGILLSDAPQTGPLTRDP
jgi:hypothetical protein